MKSKYKYFSKMTWLDDLAERNAKSPGRNDFSDWYYETLFKIRDAQNNNTIDDSLYGILEFGLEDSGYYTANIHYDLFNPVDNKEELEDRIIYFIELADCNEIGKDSWFELNFMREFTYFLSNFIYVDVKTITPEWIMEFGSEKEKEIIKLFKSLH